MLNATQKSKAKLGNLQVEGGIKASVEDIRVSHQKKRGIMTVTEMMSGARTMGILQRLLVDPVVRAKIRRIRPPTLRQPGRSEVMIRQAERFYQVSPVNNATPTTSILPLGPTFFGGVGIKNIQTAASGNATTPMNKKHHFQLMRRRTPARIRPRTDPRAPEEEKLEVAGGPHVSRRAPLNEVTMTYTARALACSSFSGKTCIMLFKALGMVRAPL